METQRKASHSFKHEGHEGRRSAANYMKGIRWAGKPADRLHWSPGAATERLGRSRVNTIAQLAGA